MTSYPSQECRPLKRPRLGAVGPDVYPQEPKQKEDELNVTNVKHGFQHQTFDDEYKTAKEKAGDLSEDRINKFFLSVINEKSKINALPETGKKKLGQNIRDIFWMVTQGSKVEPWLKDLAGTKPLTILSKKCPIFNKKEDIFKNLCDYNVPMKRAVWFIKMTNSYHTALAEARVRYRGRAVDPLTEWAQVTRDFLKGHLQKIIDHYQGHSVQSLTVTPILDLSMKYWTYGTQLAKHLYEEGLLERHEFLNFFLDQLEKHKITDDTVLKLILAQILRYMSEYVQSQLLARRLAYFCCQKISSFCQESGCPSPRTQSPALTTTPNGTVSTSSGNPPVTPQGQSGVASLFKEYNSCPQHRGLILSMCAMVQSIALRCPGSLVWHCHGEGKMSSPLSGSPLDALPCAPSCLPMPPGMDNEHLRSQLRACEDQIRMRSRMSESHWSSDKCQQSAKVFGVTIREGFTISKILQVLDKLDRQNFAKIEINHFLDTLYTEVFGVLQSKGNEPPFSEEPVVNLLCEWAVSTQRTGEYRALIVAKLLERRQSDINAEKYPDEMQDKSSDAGSEMGDSGVPEFQGLLLSFLDNQAPYLDDSPTAETKQAFCNLIHLFSELINHDVFSHDAYMCTLISRGDLTEASSLRQQQPGIALDITGVDSVRSELPKHEDSKMEVDRPHMDTDFDIFAFKDDTKPSPGQPASVKSIGPFSVPTPGQAQTPMTQPSQQQAHTPGMARTPGGPTTPLGMGARTPGNPHTPGAHTPGKATTPLGAGGLTPGMAHTPGLTPGGPTTPSRTPVHGGPHTPGIVAYLSGSGSHHSGMGHTPRTSQAQGPPGPGQVTQSLTVEDTALRAKKHLCYATHFPVPQDEFSNHECNQRFMMLYGVGKARDEARHVLKKINKEIMKLFNKKNSLDVTLGEVKRKEKKKEKVAGVAIATVAVADSKDTTAAAAAATAAIAAESATNYESTRSKFMRLNYHDQHTLTYHCSSQVLESIKSFCTGASQYLPLIENVCYLCDLMELCYNVNVLVEFLVELLKELPEVDTQLMKKNSSLEGRYTTSLCLCVVAVLRKYHAYLLVTNELTCSVFESLCNIVKHVGNPADCTSAERCILAYLYDLFTTSYHVKTKFQELFSGASAKVKAALFATVTPSVSNQEWDTTVMAELIENPGLVLNRQRLESQFVSQILEPGNRYSFVCNLIHGICSCQNVERLNELAILSAELTSKCNLLSCEWLGVLKAFCCSSNTSALTQGTKNCGFMDILYRIDLNDYNVHDSLTVFVSLLVARDCLSLDDIILHVAVPSLLMNTGPPPDAEAEQGARLTCHLLLRLFQTAHLQVDSSGTTAKPETRKNQMHIKSSTDKHLLDAAHEACDLDAIVAVLKLLILLSDTVVPTAKKSTDSGGDIIQSMLKSLDDDDDDDDLDLDLGLPGVVSKKAVFPGVEQAGLSEYARHILKEICSQSWLREKFLKDPEALLTSDLLLDNGLSHKQVQQLVHLICYPEGVPPPPPIDEDLDDIPEQRRYISRILNNMDQWKLRVSLLELQLMFKQAPCSEMNALLDNVSKATIEVFTQQTEKRQEVTSQASSWSDPDKELIWLIAPLISKLSSTAQGRVLRAAGEKLKTGNNFWTAKNASEKESYLKESISLMGHQPFLSLVLTCLKGQDEQREGLLKSLYEQLEKFVNNTKEPQDRGIPTDDRLKLMMQESLRLRMSLVGGMFDTIQRSNTLLNEWATILIQLVSCGVVSLSNSAELFMVVLDMFSVLLHGTLVPDPVEGKDDRRTYSGLVRKLKKEIGDKRNESMDLVKQLTPLSKVTIDVLVNEPHKVKKQQGFQLSGKLNTKISPWELLEGHKNPAPLSLSYFGAVRVERKPPKYEEEYRLLLNHTHSLRKSPSHYLDPPPLPPEELEPPPMERKDDMTKLDPNKVVNSLTDDSRKKPRKPKRNRTPTGQTHGTTPVGPSPGFPRPGMYENPNNWGSGNYAGGNPGTLPPHSGYMPPTLPPGGSRVVPQPGMGPRPSGKEAIERFLSTRATPTGFMGAHSQNMHGGGMIRMPKRVRGPVMNNMVHMGDGAMYPGNMGMPAFTGGGPMGTPGQGMGQNFGPGGYQQPGMSQIDQSIGAGGPNMASGNYNRAYQNPQAGMGNMSNMQSMQTNSQGQFMSGQGQMNHPNRFSMGMPSTTMSGMVGNSSGQMGGYSNMGGNAGSYSGMSQQRFQHMRQQQILMQQQQQQQQQQSGGGGTGAATGGGANPQGMQASHQQQTAALMSQLHRQMSNNPSQQTGNQGTQGPPPQYGNYGRGQY